MGSVLACVSVGVCCCICLFFFKQKTAYEMRISDWSSDVCSSDLRSLAALTHGVFGQLEGVAGAQEGFVDLTAQLIGLVAGQRRGVIQQPFGVVDQRLKILHQDFLSSLCLGSGHGWISVSDV